MHVMIATDGSLDASRTALIASKLASDGGRVTVLTVVEVPRRLLDDMRKSVGSAPGVLSDGFSVEYVRDQADNPAPTHWVGDDAIVHRYVNSTVDSRTSELKFALDALGVEYSVVGVEGENAARTVLAAAKNDDVDVLCVGTHGLGRFEGLLGSTSTKIARLATCSVVLVR
jgi:nucleotide-binding universal stress UspA family protein